MKTRQKIKNILKKDKSRDDLRRVFYKRIFEMDKREDKTCLTNEERFDILA